MDKGVSDEELILRYQQGDAMAFEILYLRHKGGVFRFLLAKCKNESLAEELFQDVWLNLISARNQYQVKAKFKTYLYRLAFNRFVDHYRKQKKVNSLINHEVNIYDENIPEDKNNLPEENLDIHQQLEMFLKLLDQLPEEQREAFVLKEESGLSVIEIAEIMGVNSETAKSRLRYAVRKLREGLKSHE